MNDLIAGLGIALVLEGLLWALAPDFARRMMREVSEIPAGQITVFAWGMVVAGMMLVWVVRGVGGGE